MGEFLACTTSAGEAAAAAGWSLASYTSRLPRTYGQPGPIVSRHNKGTIVSSTNNPPTVRFRTSRRRQARRSAIRFRIPRSPTRATRWGAMALVAGLHRQHAHLLGHAGRGRGDGATASDGNGGSVSDTFDITVAGGHHPAHARHGSRGQHLQISENMLQSNLPVYRHLSLLPAVPYGLPSPAPDDPVTDPGAGPGRRRHLHRPHGRRRQRSRTFRQRRRHLHHRPEQRPRRQGSPTTRRRWRPWTSRRRQARRAMRFRIPRSATQPATR